MNPGVSGKYRLERRLGGGGMAEVFVGSSAGVEGFSRKVAIKRVLPGYSDNAAFARMFTAEAQISSQLVHPNIVSVLDFDRDDDGRLFLVMELVDGQDLDALIASGLLPFAVVIFVIGEVLRGLGFAHDLPSGSGLRGVVHRDVSPHNVLLSWEGAVKVSDFGIAKARAASEATASVFIKGKPAYMSPEQANGERLDGRSDLFAVGVMLWEMLVGRRLFVGEDTRATLAQVLFGQIPRPRSLRPEVPRDLERITMKLLERDLAARYATAEDAIADLMNCAAAPRAGREALIAVLAERFPEAAPVRQSVARARSGGATPTPLPGSLIGQRTLTGVPEGPIASPVVTRPGASTLLAPTTGILDAPPRRGLTLILIALGSLVASGIAAFAIVSAMRRPEPSTPRTDNGTGAATSIAAAQPADAVLADPLVTRDTVGEPPHDASPGAHDDPRDGAALPIDAGARDPGKSQATAVHSAHPAPDKRSGSLRVVALPILTVTVDGKAYGDTPLTIPLKVGKHRVRLENVENTSNEVVNVTIADHQITTIDRMPQ